MLFRAQPRESFAVVGALLAYTLVAGALGAVQLSKRRRDERVQRWHGVFRGEGSGPAVAVK